MRSISRVLATAVLALPAFGLVGCAQDNEAFVKAQAEANAAKDDPAAKSAPIANQAAYAEKFKAQQQQTQSNLKSSGYPGAK